jgi:hypothetical protein
MRDKDELRGALAYAHEGDITSYDRLMRYCEILNYMEHAHAEEFSRRAQAIYPRGRASYLSNDWDHWDELEFLEAWFDQLAIEMAPDGFMYCYSYAYFSGNTSDYSSEWCGWMPIDPNDPDGKEGPFRIWPSKTFTYEPAPVVVTGTA